MLNKITHSTGVPMDPGIVEIIEANTKGMEALRVVLPLTRPVKSARILDYIVKEWSYLFTDLCLSIPSFTIAKRFSRLMRTYDFDVWTAENKIVAIKKIGGAAAKAEFAPKSKDSYEVCLSCLGEEEKRGLERLEDLFFPLIRDLIEMGLSA